MTSRSSTLLATLVVTASPQLAAQSTPPPQDPSPASAPTDAPKAASPFRLSKALGTPRWLTVSGEQRTRYESMHDQFRVRTPTPYGRDEDVLALRTSLRFDLDFESAAGTLEILDSHQFGIEQTGFADTTMVNTADVLQAFGEAKLGALGDGKQVLRAGREAIDLGSRRLMARNAYRNTINSFTGFDWIWRSEGSQVRAFWMLPVDRQPNDFDSLRDNDWELDVQTMDTQFAGLFWASKSERGSTFEAYVLGLEESGVATRRRELLTPGLRWFGNTNNNAPVDRKDAWFWEVELIGQVGESKVNANAGSPTLDHLAGFAHAQIGYAFDAPLQPAVQIAYDYATGDQDPNDRSNERFDTLFGARRFEYGPTGIWGAVARANLNSPEVRLYLTPAKGWQFQVALRGVWLAEARDTWTTAGIRDNTGDSGNHVGEQIEARLRWDVVPQSVDVEIGGAVLLEGSFQERATGGERDDANYAYVQTTFRF